MNLVQFRNSLETLALSVEGINAFTHGWLQDQNGETNLTYPYLHLTPPVQNPDRRADDWSSTYTAKLYLIAKNNSSGQRMTPSERDDVWASLQATEKLLAEAIKEDSDLDLLEKLGQFKFNEGYLTNDDPIWMEFNYKIRAKKPC